MKKFSIKDRKVLLDGEESGSEYTRELLDDLSFYKHDPKMMVSTIVELFITDISQNNKLSSEEIAEGELFLTNFFTEMVNK